MERKVSSKLELKQAVKDRVEVIIIDKNFKKDIEPIVALLRMSENKILKTITFLSISGTAIIASLATIPNTGGTSGMAALIGGIPAVVAFSATSSISVKTIVALVIICVSVGVACIVELLRAYDLEENDIEFEFGEKSIRFKRRKKYREHKC